MQGAFEEVCLRKRDVRYVQMGVKQSDLASTWFRLKEGCDLDYVWVWLSGFPELWQYFALNEELEQVFLLRF